MSITNLDFLSKSEVTTHMRAKNWNETAVGPVSSWSPVLCTTLDILLNSKCPMFLFWGTEWTLFYNDAYRNMRGEHLRLPTLLGQTGKNGWPESWEIMKPLLNQVIATGLSSWHQDQMLPVSRDGKIEESYWTLSCSAIGANAGTPSGILTACYDTSDKVRTISKLEFQNAEYRSNIIQAPSAMCILRGNHFVIEMANNLMLGILGKTSTEVVQKPIFETLPEAKGLGLEEVLQEVFTTGKSVSVNEFPLKKSYQGKIETSYLNFVYEALTDNLGHVSGILAVATDVTPNVIARHLLAESAKEFRKLVMESPIPMAIFRGKSHVIEIANNAMLQTVFHNKKNSALGKTLLKAFPEMHEQKYPALLDKVFLSGEVIREKESVIYVQDEGMLHKLFFDFECTPLLELDGKTSGIMVTLNNVTERVEARKKAEDAEERASLAVDIAEIATWELNLNTHTMVHSESLATMFGHNKTVKLSYTQVLNQIEPSDLVNIVEKAFEKAMKTSIYKYETRIIKSQGEIAWIRSHGKIFFDENNEPFKMIGTLINITEEKQNREILMESEQKFRLLSDSMPQHIYTADPWGNLNYYNQSVFNYTGLDVKQIDEMGWLNLVHPEDRKAYIKEWAQAIASGNDFLFEHRFRKNDGEYHWHFSRAIAQKDASGNVQMWVGTSTDIHNQKTFTSELEVIVKERTAELLIKNGALVKMNIELESFAYVSSHDLQEPLRKIQVFISRLYNEEQEPFSENAKEYLNRIRAAAERMQTLIQDLLSYSRTSSGDNIFVNLNLEALAQEVINDYKDVIDETQAVVTLEDLCEAPIIPFQFRQLLNNLIGNSLKFTRPGIAPHITIKGGTVTEKEIIGNSENPDKEYCHMSISDNGIGFEEEYKTRIFEVFQRLHGKGAYTGTGIGLAIVKKIVDNHKGIITATGSKNNGARFDIYIPMS